MDRLQQMLQRSSRDAAIGCALLFIDLDGFKLVNDSRHSIRPGHTVARIGGDEFALLLDGVLTERDATLVAERSRALLADWTPIRVAKSIGEGVGSR